MKTYSTTTDIIDEWIKRLSKSSDHEEAAGYIEKVLSKLNINVKTVPVTPLLKRLSVCYATYKRAFYESKTKDDVFYQIYRERESELKHLTAIVIKEGHDAEYKKSMLSSKQVEGKLREMDFTLKHYMDDIKKRVDSSLHDKLNEAKSTIDSALFHVQASNHYDGSHSYKGD